MRHLFRLFTKPSVFFNQLQWSRAHWLILFALGLFCLVETRTSDSEIFLFLVDFLQRNFALGLNPAIWLVSALKLSLLFAGVFLMTELIWVVGNVIGERQSKRVLLRRLAVVCTVFLAGASLQNLSAETPALILASAFLYMWGTVLGFHAIREQFSLNSLETAVVTVFAALIVSGTLHVSDHASEFVAAQSLQDDSAPAVSNLPESAASPFQLEE